MNNNDKHIQTTTDDDCESSPSCYDEAIALAHYEATPEDSIEPNKQRK